MSERRDSVYAFGPFRLDARQRLLFRGSEVVSLTPKAAETLLALVAQHGQVVDKGELMKLVWPDTFVEEGGLARNISLLRKTLGDDVDGANYIETIPKRGYRFVAPVSEAPTKDASVPPSPPSPAEPAPFQRRRRWLVPVLAVLLAAVPAVLFWLLRTRDDGSSVKSVTVLPLRNLSGDPAQEYFSEAITEELITDLAKIGGLQVIRVERDPRDYGPARHVVRGAVVRSGSRFRVDVQLVDTRTRTVVWTDLYERDQRDVLDVQADLARRIAREIRVTLTLRDEKLLTRSRKVDPEAYNAYSQGRYFWNRRTEESLRKSIGWFEQAIEKDPTYAPAHAGLADAYALLGSNGYDSLPPGTAMPAAKSHALKALAIEPTLADAHTTLGYVHLVYDWNLAEAEKEFRRALDLNRSYAIAHQWYAHYFIAAADLGKASAEMQRAVELAPDSLAIRVGLGWCAYYSRDYDRALAIFRSALERDPTFALAHQTLGMTYEQKKMYPEALDELGKAVALGGASPSAVAALGHAYASAGRAGEARDQLARLEALARQRYVPPLYLAWVHLGLGEHDQALEWLRKAYEEHSEYLIYFDAAPAFDGLRHDSRILQFRPFRRDL